jgi:lipopolysaccharide biosynthesis glycosyltransferase
MNKCIFICVSYQEKYIKLLYMLLESIYIFGCIDNDTTILIYTSTKFMNIIKNSHLYNNKIIFEINDNINSVKMACESRLDLFNFTSAERFDKFLYLDTDIIVKDNINHLFDIIKEDIIYAVKESGSLDTDSNNYWGGNILFSKQELDNIIDKKPFSSGIMLFNNTNKIKRFTIIKHDIVARPYHFNCYDQPYIVYNAFKYNMYDNQSLSKYCSYNDMNIHSNMSLVHFAGGVGIYENKAAPMSTFLNELKDNMIMQNIKICKSFINRNLIPIIKNSKEMLEGNIFMVHNTFQYTDLFLNKAKNISNMVINRNIKKVLEIGFNAGFSTLLMLISNPNLHITCIDLGIHNYTIPCYMKIKEIFGDRINLIIGDSTKILPALTDIYDLIHIDGGHETMIANSDIINSYKLSKNGTIIIMDDYDFPHLHTLWDTFVKNFGLIELDINTYNSPHHDIKTVVKLE